MLASVPGFSWFWGFKIKHSCLNSKHATLSYFTSYKCIPEFIMRSLPVLPRLRLPMDWCLGWGLYSKLNTLQDSWIDKFRKWMFPFSPKVALHNCNIMFNIALKKNWAWGCSTGIHIYYQAWWPEFYPSNPHGGRWELLWVVLWLLHAVHNIYKHN